MKLLPPRKLQFLAVICKENISRKDRRLTMFEQLSFTKNFSPLEFYEYNTN